MLKRLTLAVAGFAILAGCNQSEPAKYTSPMTIARYEKTADTASCKKLGDMYATTRSALAGQYKSTGGLSFEQLMAPGGLEKAQKRAKVQEALIEASAKRSQAAIQRNLNERCVGNRYTGWRKKV